MLWVYTVDVTGIYSGVHMMWVYTVDNTAIYGVDSCSTQTPSTLTPPVGLARMVGT